MMTLYIRPITLRQARIFVSKLHRHNDPPQGHKFSIGLKDEAGNLVGVAIVGRPIAKADDSGQGGGDGRNKPHLYRRHTQRQQHAIRGLRQGLQGDGIPPGYHLHPGG